MTTAAFYKKIGLEERIPALKRKLDKKLFYEQADLSPKEKNVLAKQVERIELTYLLTPATIYIQLFHNEEYQHEGIMFMTVQLRAQTTEQQITVLETMIHGALPNPVILTLYW
ncbi:hypothetical protein BpJC7_21110 [Weizmannia acidilactici]|uniref:Uncharacterized protein n=1 Tax=Weizmannia acidilactici TaxID=2607726 RepID=A0A5J4JJV1_9BACI|nr:DUF4391 domain-containing protein [Weizmannia acidilactici]GER70808.1 hypothetical protein BpJC7_21110 [Weizmannia acidilactici]GER74372.1 hypothetical protein BpPP18_24390 [Weizmannia acidilactici]